MIHELHVAVPNAVILVMDRATGIVPDSMNGGLAAATESCVAIGTISECDGKALISLSDETPPGVETQLLVFDGILRTPNKRLSVCSILDNPLLDLDLPGSATRVRVWTNDRFEPNQIWIVAGSAS